MLRRTIFTTLLAAGLAGAAQAQVWQEWVARYDYGNYGDCASAITVDGDGNVYVTGYTSSGAGTNSIGYGTIKYDNQGAELWQAHYYGSGNSGNYPSSIAVDDDGNVYVTGSSSGNGTGWDYATLKYDASGQQQWVARYNGPMNGTDKAYALAVDGSGNVYVTGSSWGPGTYEAWEDYATIKYDSYGNQLWVARYNGPANGYDAASALAVDASGNVYVTGTSYQEPVNEDDYATIKYDAAGNQLWVARYNSGEDDDANDLAVDDGGNVYVTGGGGGGEPHHYATIKYDASGSELWVAIYNGPGDSDNAVAIVLDDGGKVYITGWSQQTGISPWNYDYATVKYDPAGYEQWVARYDGPVSSSDYAYSLAVDDSGGVYVTGESPGGGTNSDYATIKYTASGGSVLWVMRYNGPGNAGDHGRSIALDGDENVYVTGVSVGEQTGDDYATIKYNQSVSHPIEVTLTPINPPITIPARGGIFNFTISVARLLAPQQPFSTWARIKNPNGTYTSPTLGPLTINLPVGVTITRQRTQAVPGAWPAGVYTYLAYVNSAYGYPAVDSSLFTFTKSTAGDHLRGLTPGGLTVWEATCTGELFSGEATVSSQLSIFGLFSASPNPFNPTTVANFELRVASHVSLKIYDTAGRLIDTLLEGWREAGSIKAIFDGSKLVAGVYLLRLEAGPEVQVEKVVLLK